MRQWILLVLEEAERRASKRIEPRGTAADRAEKCNANPGIEAQQVRAHSAHINRPFDPHGGRSDLATVGDPHFICKPFSNRERQGGIPEECPTACADTEQCERNQCRLTELDDPTARPRRLRLRWGEMRERHHALKIAGRRIPYCRGARSSPVRDSLKND